MFIKVVRPKVNLTEKFDIPYTNDNDAWHKL